MAILFVGFASTANAQKANPEKTLQAFEKCITDYKKAEIDLAKLQQQAQDPTAKNSVSKEIKELSDKMTNLIEDAKAYRDGKKGKPALTQENRDKGMTKDQVKRYDRACADLEKILAKKPGM